MPQLQFVFRGWDFPVSTQRQVPTVQTPRSGAVLGVVAMPVVVQRLTPGSGQFRQLWLPFSGGGTAAGGGGRRLRLLRPGWGLITQVMSPCKLVSVTAVHRHVVVNIHAFVVNPLEKQQKTTTTTTTTRRLSQACTFFVCLHLSRWTSAPGPELLSVASSDDARGGDTSSSRIAAALATSSPQRTAPEDGQRRGAVLDVDDAEDPHFPARALRAVVRRRARRFPATLSG